MPSHVTYPHFPCSWGLSHVCSWNLQPIILMTETGDVTLYRVHADFFTNSLDNVKFNRGLLGIVTYHFSRTDVQVITAASLWRYLKEAAGKDDCKGQRQRKTAYVLLSLPRPMVISFLYLILYWKIECIYPKVHTLALLVIISLLLFILLLPKY